MGNKNMTGITSTRLCLSVWETANLAVQKLFIFLLFHFILNNANITTEVVGCSPKNKPIRSRVDHLNSAPTATLPLLIQGHIKRPVSLSRKSTALSTRHQLIQFRTFSARWLPSKSPQNLKIWIFKNWTRKLWQKKRAKLHMEKSESPYWRFITSS